MADTGVIGALSWHGCGVSRVCLARVPFMETHPDAGVRTGVPSVRVEVGVDGPEGVSTFGVDGMCDVFGRV